MNSLRMKKILQLILLTNFIAISTLFSIPAWAAGSEDIIEKQRKAEKKTTTEYQREEARSKRFDEVVSIIESVIVELSKKGVQFQSFSIINGEVKSPWLTWGDKPIYSTVLDSRIDNKLIVVEESLLGAKYIYFTPMHGRTINVSITFYKNNSWEIKMPGNNNDIKFHSYTDEKELNDKQVLIKNKVAKLIKEAL